MESFRNARKIGHRVYKRKRKCIALEESKACSSKAIVPLNAETSKAKADDRLVITSRAVGGDGHFYVCVRCNDVGQLLCCDTCSCTYHLHCLNPPLASTPEGDWQCPNCSESDNDKLPEPALDFETAICNKILSLNQVNNAPFICSLCSKTKKVLILSDDEYDMPKYSSTDHYQPANSPVGFDNCAMEHDGGPSSSDAGISDPMIQQTPNKDKSDKLLILRDVMQQMVDEHEKTKKNKNEETDAMKQLVPVDTQAGQLQKDENAELHARQEERLASGNKGKGVISSSRPDGLKLSSDLPIVKCGESVKSDALANKLNGAGTAQRSCSIPSSGQDITIHLGADAHRLSLVPSSGQDITTPSSPLHKVNGSSSGFTPTMPPERRPSGYHKRRHIEKYAWSELELDALWVGVRRYGQGQWDTILADPSLSLLKDKTPENLYMKWNEELLRTFPSQKPTRSLLPTAIPYRSIPPPISDRNRYTDATTTTIQFLPSKAPPSLLSGFQMYPVGVGNHQSLMPTNSFPSLNSGILGSNYNHGSSSRVSHNSFQKAADHSVPRWLSNINRPPVVSELMVQTPNQRANQTPALAMAARRESSSSSTRTETKLLLGGYFPLRVLADPGNSKSNPIQVETDDEN